MINGKTVSFEHIMDRVFNIGLNPKFIDADEAKELMFTAVATFGSAEAYYPKVERVTIAEHRGALPCDIFDITHGGVRHYPSGIPLDAQTSVYQPDDVAINAPQEVDPWYLDPNAGTLVNSSRLPTDSMTYYIRGGYIYTGFPTGEVEIAYQAFPVDDRGYPVIPDNERIIKGVVYTIAQAFAAKAYMRDELSREKLDYIDKEYLWYVASASNALRVPTLDRMENIKNMMNNPHLNFNARRNYYRGIGRQPQFPTHTTK